MILSLLLKMPKREVDWADLATSYGIELIGSGQTSGCVLELRRIWKTMLAHMDW